MKYRIKYLLVFLSGGVLFTTSFAQKAQMIKVVKESNNQVTILADGKPFTSLIYPDSLEKPVLYPIYAADGELITRGYPIAPRQHEPVDHPHHIGLWLNYENVNGLDFWNNSSAIAANKKSQYGWIRTDSILQAGIYRNPGTLPTSPGTTSGGRTSPSGAPISAGTARSSRKTGQQGI